MVKTNSRFEGKLIGLHRRYKLNYRNQSGPSYEAPEVRMIYSEMKGYELEKQDQQFFILMNLGVSRKIEGRSTIVRPSKQQHLQTYHIPYQKSVQAIGYYARKKRQMRARNLIFYPQKQYERTSELQSLQKSIEIQPDNDRGFMEGITQISVEPVLTDNKFTNFNPELYPLNESQKVKVVEEKYFPLQNYYNYIYALKTREEIFKLAEETQKKANEVLAHRKSKYQSVTPTLDLEDRKGPLMKQTHKIRGPYESRFEPSGYHNNMSVSRTIRLDQLSPIHFTVDPEPGNSTKRFSTPFDVKEIDRIKILEEMGTKYRKN